MKIYYVWQKFPTLYIPSFNNINLVNILLLSKKYIIVYDSIIRGRKKTLKN